MGGLNCSFKTCVILIGAAELLAFGNVLAVVSSALLNTQDLTTLAEGNEILPSHVQKMSNAFTKFPPSMHGGVHSSRSRHGKRPWQDLLPVRPERQSEMPVSSDPKVVQHKIA